MSVFVAGCSRQGVVKLCQLTEMKCIVQAAGKVCSGWRFLDVLTLIIYIWRLLFFPPKKLHHGFMIMYHYHSTRDCFRFLFLLRKLHHVPQCAWTRKLLTVKVVQILIRLKRKSSFSSRGRKYADPPPPTLPPFFLMQNKSHAIAQTPCIYDMQKSPDRYDRMCFNLRLWAVSLSLSRSRSQMSGCEVGWVKVEHTYIYIYIYIYISILTAARPGWVTSNKVSGSSLHISVSSHTTIFPTVYLHTVHFNCKVDIQLNFFFVWQEAGNGHATETPLHHQSHRIPASPVLILV